MTEKEGWIKTYRKIQDCWIWQIDKPFDERSAWIDLLLSANHKQVKIQFNGELILVERGQFITSVRKLSDKWKWNKDKTLKFLRLLESDKMIKRDSDKYRTLITIENYEVYQDKADTERTVEGAPQGTVGGTQDGQEPATNKNEKNEKNIIKPPLSPLEGETKEKTSKTDYIQMIRDRQFDKSLEEVIIEWYRYKTEKRQAYKPTGFSKFLTEVQNNVMKYGVDAVIEVVNVSMANNWQGVTWDKLKNTNDQFKKSSSDVLSKYLNGGNQ